MRIVRPLSIHMATESPKKPNDAQIRVLLEVSISLSCTSAHQSVQKRPIGRIVAFHGVTKYLASITAQALLKAKWPGKTGRTAVTS